MKRTVICQALFFSLQARLSYSRRSVSGVSAKALREQPRSLADGRCVYGTQLLPDLLEETHWGDVSLSQYGPTLSAGTSIGTRITNQNLELLTFSDAASTSLLTVTSWNTCGWMRERTVRYTAC